MHSLSANFSHTKHFVIGKKKRKFSRGLCAACHHKFETHPINAAICIVFIHKFAGRNECTLSFWNCFANPAINEAFLTGRKNNTKLIDRFPDLKDFYNSFDPYAITEEDKKEFENNLKKFNDHELKSYLSKITDEALYAYNVYQIEGEGRNLFSDIKGDENTIMGLPIKQIKDYLEEIKWKNI